MQDHDYGASKSERGDNQSKQDNKIVEEREGETSIGMHEHNYGTSKRGRGGNQSKQDNKTEKEGEGEASMGMHDHDHGAKSSKSVQEEDNGTEISKYVVVDEV